MDKGIDRVVAEYLELIKKKYPGIEGAYLLGSCAKGNSTKDSDIDLALVFRDLDDSNRFDLQVQLMLLAAKIDSRIEPHPFSHDDFNSGNPFVIELKRQELGWMPDYLKCQWFCLFILPEPSMCA